MISVVLMILDVLKLCKFSWWIVFVESIAVLVVCFLYSEKHKSDLFPNILITVSVGTLYFSCLKLFCALTISPWWILLSPILFIVAAILPGGFIGTKLLFQQFGLASAPTWTLVVSGFIDAISLVLLILIIVDSVKNKQNKN